MEIIIRALYEHYTNLGTKPPKGGMNWHRWGMKCLLLFLRYGDDNDELRADSQAWMGNEKFSTGAEATCATQGTVSA
jgi:hypothetical protein